MEVVLALPGVGVRHQLSNFFEPLSKVCSHNDEYMQNFAFASALVIAFAIRTLIISDLTYDG